VKKTRMRPLIFGEVLFDCFEDDTVVLGGAPFNVAWHLQAFGLNPMMITRIGNDDAGKKIQQAMADWGMDCAGLQIDNSHPTGSVEVTFKDGEPDYDIVDQVAYDYIDASSLPALQGEYLLYHGSLALRHTDSANTLQQLKHTHANKLFVDINLRSPWWDQKSVLKLIEGADWLKLNEQELIELYAPDISQHDQQLAEVLPQLSEQLVLTGGESGAMTISALDGKQHTITPQGKASVVDTVGAGDSFCSVLLAGRILNWPLDVSLSRAQEFASAIVGIKGATPEHKQFYKPFIVAWDIKDLNHV
jgi:fructokinase